MGVGCHCGLDTHPSLFTLHPPPFTLMMVRTVTSGRLVEERNDDGRN